MGSCLNLHCSRPFNSILKRAKLKYGAYREKTPCALHKQPTQDSWADPLPLEAVGLGQTGGRQGRRMTERERGRLRTGAAWLPCSPDTQLCSPFLPNQASWPQPGWRSLGESNLGPGFALSSGASGGPITLALSLTPFIWLDHSRGL